MKIWNCRIFWMLYEVLTCQMACGHIFGTYNIRLPSFIFITLHLFHNLLRFFSYGSQSTSLGSCSFYVAPLQWPFEHQEHSKEKERILVGRIQLCNVPWGCCRNSYAPLLQVFLQHNQVVCVKYAVVNPRDFFPRWSHNINCTWECLSSWKSSWLQLGASEKKEMTTFQRQTIVSNSLEMPLCKCS